MNKKNSTDDQIVEDVINENDVMDDDKNQDERDEKIASLEDQLKRAVADYRNLERRSIEERIEAIKFANKNLIDALIPAFDTLFLAAKFTADESVKLTVDRIVSVLKENGIEKVKTDKAEYNAGTMECIEVVEGEEGKVIEEVRPGFTINGKLIRPAQVKVGK